MPTPSFERGVLHLDGRPMFLLSGDYPYYRDRREHWRARLEAIEEAGLKVVTTYVPWRHHAPRDPLRGEGGYDLDGRTQPNRDVRGFLRACEEIGLFVVLKPGPFVHAELRYGGLPDYVDPGRRGDIEPERDGSGRPYAWTAPGGEPGRALPAPLDETFCAYVRDWFVHVGRDVIAPFAAPRGPVIGVQVLNEGIYSDSASGLIPNYGYSASSLRAWHRFLARRYGALDRYNATHASDHRAWSEVPAPAAVAPASRRAAMLTYLDRSRFLHALYMDVVERYVGFLREAGVPREVPLLMNHCANVREFRRHVASNDGWYSKVAWHPGLGVQWGYTDWIGVAEHDPRAYLQYVLCATRERGPNLEENWGFGDIYDPAYAATQPSYFQSLLSLAAGATGLNVYTMVGTSAWRDDHNIDTVGIPRVARARPPHDEDYPSHAPIASDGSLHPKYWTIAQLAHHLGAEGASLVGDRRVDVAWAVYPPYAWAGAWAPGGEADEGPWLAAGFRAMPRVSFRGLEAVLETASVRGLDVAQVDVMQAEEDEIGRYRCLVLAGYDFMDARTQGRLAQFVEAGGCLVLTGFVPWLDEDLQESEDGALRRRLFDHAAEEVVPLGGTMAIRLEGEDAPWALARDRLVHVEPPAGTLGRFVDEAGATVGYACRRGAGVAVYLGFAPWWTALHGDDPRLVAACRGLLESVVGRFTAARPRYAFPADGGPDLDVWQYGAFDPARLDGARGITDIEHVVAVHRGPVPAVREIVFTRRDGALTRFRLHLVPGTVCVLTFEHGRARSLLLKCVNDHDGVAVPPLLEEPGGTWSASGPCDLCVTRVRADSLDVLVANAVDETVTVDIPVPSSRVRSARDGHGREVAVEKTRNGASLRVRDLRLAGVHRIELEPGLPVEPSPR